VANRGSLNGNSDSITIYAPGSNGNVAPTATISGSNTTLLMPSALTLDSQGNIYVANEGSAAGGQDTVTVYPSGSNGNSTPTRTITGSSTGLASPMGIAVDSTGNIYVSSAVGTNAASMLLSNPYVPSAGSTADTNAVSILIYAPASNGNVAPTTSIDGDCAILNAPGSLALANGNLYVTNPANLASGDESVVVYNNISVAAGPPQCLTPASQIFGPNTGINQPFGVASDPSGNIYITNSESNSITAFPSTANQNTVPSATIASPNGMVNPTAVAIDSSGNIYVANAGADVGMSDSVTIYPPASNASSAPSRVIGGVGPNDLSQLNDPSAITVASGIWVANALGGANSQGSLTWYSKSSNGNSVPQAAISGSSTGINEPVGVAVGSLGYIYALNASGGPSGSGSITIYNPGSSGNVAPEAVITGANTGISFPSGLALDSSNKIYVTNDGSIAGNIDSVAIFAGGSSGNVAPTAIISGANTQLNLPQGIAIDKSGNIYVSNNGSVNGGIDAITVYAPGSSGNVAPIQTISGSLTGLSLPAALAVGP
jgi:sugar lactone lactonase YvrE